MRKITTFKCPECGMKFSSMPGWSKHIKVHHPGLKPKGYTDMQFLYYCITGKTHGKCIQCGKDTTWNEANGKYNRFCNNPKCKQEYTKIAKQRMIDKYGKAHLLNDPNMQRKMLKNKSISGSYKFSNKSGYVDYVGSYEKDFLYTMDHIMGFSAKDIMGPSPHNYIYMYEGKAHVYIPDFYIPNYNLEIEIKTDENMHHKIQAVDKVKEKLKDEVMSKNPSVNYFKILDKDYTEFFKYLTDKKFEIDDAAMENMNAYIQSRSPRIDAALEEVEPATENVIIPKKDGVYNLEKWKPGPNNILFVTGFSGSGKTTLAEEYAKKYNAYKFELDNIEYGYDSSGMGILEKIYKKFPTWKQKFADYKAKKTSFPMDMYNDIMAYVVKICHEDKNNLYVIEGIQMAGADVDQNGATYKYVDLIKGQPLIVKGTSMLTSSIRAAKRNINNGDADNSIKEYKRSIKCNMRMQKHLDGFEKAATEEAEPATENLIVSKKDTIRNIEKWEPGPNNILFVTGLSGSGKTTLAEEYEKKYNAHMFEIDGIEHGYDSSGKGILAKVYKKYPEAKDREQFNPSGHFNVKLYDAVIDEIIRICHEDSKNLYIIEGIQLADKDKEIGFAYKKYVSGQPLIIKGTSVAKSYIQGTIRDKKNADQDPSFRRLKYTIGNDKRLQEFDKEVAKEGSLPAEDRTDFGIPSLKKYPMPDAKHVKLAIKFFNYVDKEHEAELAKNIKKYAKKYGVELEAGENNRFSNYL